MFKPKEKLTYSDLCEIKVTVPDEAGASWLGIAHKEVPPVVTNAFNQREMWGVVQTNYAVTPNNQNLVASFTLSPEKTKVEEIKGWNFCFAVLTNNERRRATEFFYGIKNSVTGIVFGTIDGGRNTNNNPLPILIESVMDELEQKLKTVKTTLKTLDNTELSKRYQDHLIMNACRLTLDRGQFPWSKLGIVEKKRSKSKSAWSLMYAFSQACDTCPPYRQMDQKLAFQEILLNAEVHEKVGQ